MPPTIETKIKATKTERIKAWAPIVTAIVALLSAIVVAWISAPSSKVDGIAKNLDEKVIPKLNNKVNELQIKIAELDVYRKVFEKEIDELKAKASTTGPVEPLAIKVSAAKEKMPEIKKFELPKVQMEQRVMDTAPVVEH